MNFIHVNEKQMMMDEQTDFIYYRRKFEQWQMNFIHANEKWMMLTKFHTLWMKIE